MREYWGPREKRYEAREVAEWRADVHRKARAAGLGRIAYLRREEYADMQREHAAGVMAEIREDQARRNAEAEADDDRERGYAEAEERARMQYETGASW